MTVTARALYLEENVGIEALSVEARALYLEENRTMWAHPLLARALYLEENVVAELPPPPPLPPNEIFHPDHRFQFETCEMSNQLVRYTVNRDTPGSPLVEAWSGGAWRAVGKLQLQAYDGATYTPLPCQESDLIVVSPDETVWEERRYDAAGTAFARVVGRIRRGSRIVEIQVISASGQGLIGDQSVSLVNGPAGTLITAGDGTAVSGSGGVLTTLPVSGFLYLSRPVGTAAASGGSLHSGLHVPAGTISRFGVLAGVHDDQYTALGSMAAYIQRWSAYNRVRVKQRILV